MSPDDVTPIQQAFGRLRQGIEKRLDGIQNQISEAAQDAEYDEAERYARQARELIDLRDDLDALETRFNHLIEPITTEPDESQRLRRGLKTPQEQYKTPILQALVELGGESDLNPLLDRVYEMMEDQLNEYDHESLSSNPNMPRWRNTAQWARNSLREDGLIRDDTPRGIWAISNDGRRWLEEQKDVRDD